MASADVRRELLARIAACDADAAASSRDGRASLLAVLLLAAELETALEDVAWPARSTAHAFTDACAEAWWTGSGWDGRRWSRALLSLALPERIVLKRAEGYAYYALDPASYAQAASELVPGRVLVVGVRSIGTSLGAVVRASLLARGSLVERISVRPGGHAWERRCELGADVIERLRRFEATRCLVVDEGPGLSGSTFLSVGEALESAGIERDRITFFTSHQPDPARLVASDAARRWSRFHVQVVPDLLEVPAELDLGAGRWRAHVLASPGCWPACWTMLERRKFRRAGSPDLIKFVGFSPYGDAPLERGRLLGEAGFCPPVEPDAPGYLRQRWCEGQVLGAAYPAGFLPRVVDYLAFRSKACSAPDVQTDELEAMLRLNVMEATGSSVPTELRLEVCRPVYPDGRLLPHEWIVSPGAPPMKVDAIDHGDDHLLPGPCDSAWDLAGAIVELRLTEAQTRELLGAYQSRTGDDATRRLPAYLVAYLAYRVGYLDMALLSADADERERLSRARGEYVGSLRQHVARVC